MGILALHAQSTDLTQSGYTSLTIRLTGDFPEQPAISSPHIIHPLSPDKLGTLETVNDSTFMVSFFTFGPSTVYFNFDKRYVATLLLPNQPGVLTIHYTDSTDYAMDYEGPFEEIFANSHRMPELIQEAFEYSPETTTTENEVEKEAALAYRDAQLDGIRQSVQEMNKDVQPKLFKDYYSFGITDYFKSALPKYVDTLLDENAQIEQRAVYYKEILTPHYVDTLSLLSSGYYTFLQGVRNDSLLQLPSVRDVDPADYHAALNRLFADIFPLENNLFYDMFIAGAYIDQINKDQLLSTQQRNQLQAYFKNPHLTNYIFVQDDLKAGELKNVNLDVNKYHFPFRKEQDSVLTDILARYKDKVVVMDFWATWCGPCLAAFEEIKTVKEKYADLDEVVFVYMTNESSEYYRWNDYLKFVGGEHYYLYNDQHKIIGDQLAIEVLPSYIIFGKDGEIREKNLTGGYMGNEKLIEWIEASLTE